MAFQTHSSELLTSRCLRALVHKKIIRYTSGSIYHSFLFQDGYEEDLFTWNLLDARRSVARANVTLTPPAGIKPGPISLLATGDLLSSAMYAARLPPAAAGDPPHAVRPLAAGCVLLDYLQVRI